MERKTEDLGWRFAPFKAGNETQIIALMQEDIELRKSKAIFDQEFWNWKYKENSAGYYPNWISLAESNAGGLHNGVVGHYTVIPAYLEIDGAKVLCGQSVDTLTHNDFRGRGIFTGLAKKCYERVEESGVYLLYGYPNENSYSGFIKKLGWSDIFTVEELVYILNPERVSSIKFKNPVMRQLGRFFLFARSGYYNYVNRWEPKANYDIVHDCQFRNEHVEAARKLRNRYRFFIDRSLEYLTWRYLENPIDKEVIVKSFFEASVPRGFYVLKIKKYPHRGNLVIGHIMELITSPNDSSVINNMLSDIAGTARFKDADILHVYTHSKQHDYGILRKSGFMKFDKKHFIARLNKKTSNNNGFHDEKNWYISLGDSDRA